MVAMFFFSCEKETALFEDNFHVKYEGAIMPVYIRGNIDSDIIILFLHGGPGGNASQATFIPSFQELEAQFAMAFWDQRASGLAQGNPDESTFTLEQFVEDTDAVVESLKYRYPGKQIFLFGHSWGGALGAAYLSTDDYQEKVSGFVCMNSGHNLLEGLPLSLDWVENYANEQLLLESNSEYWTEVSDWCSKNPDMTIADNYFTYVKYLKETDAYRHENQDVEIDPVGLNDVLNSRLSLAIMMNGAYLSQNFNILELNLSGDMERITIPTLVLWGKHDGVNVLEMAYDAYDALGTQDSDKYLEVLNNSAHEGYLEEPDLFYQSVKHFVETYE